MLRLIMSLICLLAAGTAASTRASAQAGYDRPGADYANFRVQGGDPAACAARCDRDGRCQAWAFSYPATAGADSICWLKDQAVPRVPNTCCNSGVRGASIIEPHTGALEHAIDRPGGDYGYFELAPDPTGKPCQAACEADKRCRAWTYVRPGYIGRAARCYLKNVITPPRRQPYAISGVVR